MIGKHKPFPGRCVFEPGDLRHVGDGELQGFLWYSGEGGNIGTCRGVVELLELVVILLF